MQEIEVDMKAVRVRKLPQNKTTLDGMFWAEIDGNPVNYDGRVFWFSRDAALKCAAGYLLSQVKK